jgi:hypothetical protein
MKYFSLTYWAYVVTASLATFNLVVAPPRVSPFGLILGRKQNDCTKLLEFQECIELPNKRLVKRARDECLTMKFVDSYNNYIDVTNDANHLYIRYSDSEPNKGIFQRLKSYRESLNGKHKRYLEFNNDEISLTIRSGLPLHMVGKLIKIMNLANPFSGYMLKVDRNDSYSNENGYFTVSLPKGDRELKNFIHLLRKHKSMLQTPNEINSILSENRSILIYVRHNRIGKIIREDDIDTIETIHFRRMSRPLCVEDNASNDAAQQSIESTPNPQLEEYINIPSRSTTHDKQ